MRPAECGGGNGLSFDEVLLLLLEDAECICLCLKLLCLLLKQLQVRILLWTAEPEVAVGDGCERQQGREANKDVAVPLVVATTLEYFLRQKVDSHHRYETPPRASPIAAAEPILSAATA